MNYLVFDIEINLLDMEAGAKVLNLSNLSNKDIIILWKYTISVKMDQCFSYFIYIK